MYGMSSECKQFEKWHAFHILRLVTGKEVQDRATRTIVELDK